MPGTLVLILMSGAQDLELTFVDSAWLRTILHFLYLLPLLVAGIGVREAALVVLHAPSGISSAQIVACLFLLMRGLPVIVGIGGVQAPDMYLRHGNAAP